MIRLTFGQVCVFCSTGVYKGDTKRVVLNVILSVEHGEGVYLGHRGL